MLEEAFWRAIQESPDDDAPRLIYADWLEEQGEPSQVARAEFIRVQCELARLSEDARDRRTELEQCEAALWKKHRKEWLSQLKPFSPKITFRRGFPDQVLVHCKTFLEQAAQVLSAAPLFSIRLRNAKEQIVGLVQCHALARLSSLSLYYNHIGMKRARVFFASPHLGNLSELDLEDNQVQPDGLRALTQANLPRLKSLNLRANKLADAGLEILAIAPLLGQLRLLDLSHNDLGDSGVAALASSPHSAGLVSLDLAYNLAIGDEGARALADSPYLARLAHLSFDLTVLQEGYTCFFVPSANSRTSGLTESGAWALTSGSLDGLANLNLNGQRHLGDTGVRALAELPGLPRLKTLALSMCGIHGPGLEALGAASFAAGLASLDLTGNPLGNEGAKALASVNLPGLRQLVLRASNIGVRGAATLASSPHLAGLTHLDLPDNPLTEGGKKKLCTRFGTEVFLSS